MFNIHGIRLICSVCNNVVNKKMFPMFDSAMHFTYIQLYNMNSIGNSSDIQ